MERSERSADPVAVLGAERSCGGADEVAGPIVRPGGHACQVGDLLLEGGTLREVPAYGLAGFDDLSGFLRRPSDAAFGDQSEPEYEKNEVV